MEIRVAAFLQHLANTEYQRGEPISEQDFILLYNWLVNLALLTGCCKNSSDGACGLEMKQML